MLEIILYVAGGLFGLWVIWKLFSKPKKSDKPFTRIDSMRYTKTKTVNGQRMVYDSHNDDWLMWYVLFSDYSYPGDCNNIARDVYGTPHYEPTASDYLERYQNESSSYPAPSYDSSDYSSGSSYSSGGYSSSSSSDYSSSSSSSYDSGSSSSSSFGD